MNPLLANLRQKIKSNPTGLYVLFYTEMWELFGRFGIFSILILYLTNTFHIPDAKAFGLYSAFIALIFATPIIGGYLSDRFLGSRRAIIFGAATMMIGDALMIIPVEWVVFLGLTIVAVGSGFFLPSIPPMVSALYENDESKRDAGFTLYYLGKNIGALLAPVFCGFIGEYFGYNYAFILSSLGMLSGLLVFILGGKHLQAYAQQASETHALKRYLGLAGRYWVYLIAAVLVPLIMWIIEANLIGGLLAATGVVVAMVMAYILWRRCKEDKKRIVAILLAIFFVIIFEAFLGQGGTTLNLFIERNVDRHLLGIVFPPGFFYALDPVFMLTAGPFLAGFWMRLAKKGKEPAVTTKFAIGLMLLALGFMVFVWAAHTATSGGLASMLFVVLAYFLFPIAELSIIPISLSLVTKVAPKDLAALMVSIWMLSNAASSYFTGMISKLGQVNFKLNTTAQLEHAALIYQHLFANTAKVLAIAAVLALLLGPLMKRLRPAE